MSHWQSKTTRFDWRKKNILQTTYATFGKYPLQELSRAQWLEMGFGVFFCQFAYKYLRYCEKFTLHFLSLTIKKKILSNFKLCEVKTSEAKYFCLVSEEITLNFDINVKFFVK